jgi:hypothetical protein
MCNGPNGIVEALTARDTSFAILTGEPLTAGI